VNPEPDPAQYTEIEAKFRVEDHTAVRRRLKSAGAEYVGRYLEDNHILDRADGSLRSGGCGLRVRSVETLDGLAACPTLTFKGRVQSSKFKNRTEIETTVGDPTAVLALLKELGHVVVLRFRKRRERWRLANCQIELDEVPLLGSFIEIEGPDENAIAKTCRQLDLPPDAHVRKSYVRMLTEKCHDTGVSPLNIDFS